MGNDDVTCPFKSALEPSRNGKRWERTRLFHGTLDHPTPVIVVLFRGKRALVREGKGLIPKPRDWGIGGLGDWEIEVTTPSFAAVCFGCTSRGNNKCAVGQYMIGKRKREKDWSVTPNLAGMRGRKGVIGKNGKIRDRV